MKLLELEQLKANDFNEEWLYYPNHLGKFTHDGKTLYFDVDIDVKYNLKTEDLFWDERGTLSETSSEYSYCIVLINDVYDDNDILIQLDTIHQYLLESIIEEEVCNAH